jgi:hypothetical protein
VPLSHTAIPARGGIVRERYSRGFSRNARITHGWWRGTYARLGVGQWRFRYQFRSAELLKILTVPAGDRPVASRLTVDESGRG